MTYAIVGRRFKGKTTLAYCLAQRRGLRAIYDPRLQFTTSPAYEFLLLEDADRAEVIVQPDNDAAIEFEAFCQTIRAWIQERPDVPRTIIFDEVRFYKRSLVSSPAFNYILRCGDFEHVNVIMTCHRASDLHPDIRSIVDVWNVFQTTEPIDLKIWQDRCGDEFCERVQQLADRQFLSWDDSRGVLTAYEDPRVWFVPFRPVESQTTASEESES